MIPCFEELSSIKDEGKKLSRVLIGRYWLAHALFRYQDFRGVNPGKKVIFYYIS